MPQVISFVSLESPAILHVSFEGPTSGVNKTKNETPIKNVHALFFHVMSIQRLSLDKHRTAVKSK